MKAPTSDTAGGVVKGNARKASTARQISSEDREWLRAVLHDGLGQLLTSISFLAGSLRQKLAAQKLPEETDAAEILTLTGRAISETQALVQEHDARPSETQRVQ